MVTLVKYSIIIPVYNAQDTLKRCLDSILRQDCKDYEIILVNDGSSDNSLNICKDYALKYDAVKVINKKNGGVSSARNAGINASKGEFILFVDSDDYVEDAFFEELLNIDSSVDFALFAQRKKKNDKFLFQPMTALVSQKSDNLFATTKDLILSRKISCPYAKLLKKSLIDEENLRFDESLYIAEDFIFCLEYLMKCKSVELRNTSIYISDKSNDNSLTRSKKENLIDYFPLVFDKAFQLIEQSEFNDKQKNELFSVCDKLHVDSFVTCVLEELKDEQSTAKQIKHKIKELCNEFYSKYSKTYGYQNIIHFSVRFCIKNKFASLLYYLGRIYMKIRSRRIV